MKESDLQVQVADYLRLQYPELLFRSDFGAGLKLTIGQAARQARQNGRFRAWPDMFIAHPVADPEDSTAVISGLFIELKRDGVRLKKRDGSWATTHIAEQAEVLRKLSKLGYMAEFAVGFDEAKELIDAYLTGNWAEEVENGDGTPF